MLRGNKFVKKLKEWDFHPKSPDETKEKSSFGAAVTIVVIIFLVILLISEIRDYNTPIKEDVLVVNHNRGEKMKINLRITFVALPCSSVGIDITDRFGEEKIEKQIAKVPYRGDLYDLQKSLYKTSWLNNLYKQEGKLWDGLQSLRIHGKDTTCYSCYEAEQKKGQCCNSCQKLKEAFAENGLDINKAEKYPQCSDPKQTEGCLVSGTLEVNKMQGNFHVAVGESHVGHGKGHHHHWPSQYRKAGFNTTHYIHHISFGEEFPGMKNPLDGFTFVEHGIGQQQYFIQVVPTIYEKQNGDVIETNQFSVTYHHSQVNLDSEHIELPGIFFKYDISPLVIKISEKSKSFSSFITRSFALIGGIWVVVGLIYKTSKLIGDKIMGLLNS